MNCFANRVCTFSALALTAFISFAPAYACQAGANFSGLPVAGAAVTQWENAKGMLLTAGARTRLGVGICTAIERISAQSGVTQQDIDSQSGAAIRGYLDDTSAGNPTLMGLAPRLEAPFVLNANPWLPEPVVIVQVHINYTKNVDSLIVDGVPITRGSVLMAELGNVKISGVLAGRAVCAGTLKVSSAGPNQFSC